MIDSFGIILDLFHARETIHYSGMPVTTAKLYIGKKDGFPYLKTGIDEKNPMKVTYTYKDVTAPQLSFSST